MNIEALSELLHETSEHHGEFEAGGSGPDDAAVAANRYMAEVKHVVVTPA